MWLKKKLRWCSSAKEKKITAKHHGLSKKNRLRSFRRNPWTRVQNRDSRRVFVKFPAGALLLL